MMTADNICLVAQRTLIARSLSEIRMTQGVENREPIRVAEFIAEVAANAGLEANARKVRLTVACADDGARVEAEAAFEDSPGAAADTDVAGLQHLEGIARRGDQVSHLVDKKSEPLAVAR
jgi:hypothetical protein